MRSSLSSVYRAALFAAILILVIAFVSSAQLRALNFDESLALRAGWLLIDGTAASPSMYMPFTVGLGAVAHYTHDPAILIAALRWIAALSTILAAMAAVWSATDDSLTRQVALLLVLLSGPFICHGFEFRYDWAVNTAWFIGFFLICSKSRWKFLLLGILIAWLATHHLKGVFFAAALAAIAAISTAGVWRRDLRLVLHVLSGILVGLAIWLVVSFSLGKESLIFDTYRLFSVVAETSSKAPVSKTLLPFIARDGVWWAAVCIGAVLGLGFSWRQERAWLLLAFICAPVLFIFLHPHAWRYMLVPLVPFIAVLGALGIVECLKRHSYGLSARGEVIALIAAGIVSLGSLAAGADSPGRNLLIVVAAFIFILVASLVRSRGVRCKTAITALTIIMVPWTVVSMSGWAHYGRSLSLTMETQVAMMRDLQRSSVLSDGVLDPSGLAYFRRPGRPEWYVDTLFFDLVKAGSWMRAEMPNSPERWVVKTYRLRMLPEKEIARINSDYCAVGGALLRLKDVAGSCPPSSTLHGAGEYLPSFW